MMGIPRALFARNIYQSIQDGTVELINEMTLSSSITVIG